MMAGSSLLSLGWACAILLVCTFGKPTVATQWTVCGGSSCSYANISSAVNASVADDVIFIYEATYNESIWLTHNLTFVANGTVSITASAGDNWITIFSGYALTMNGSFTITGGFDVRGRLVQHGSLSVTGALATIHNMWLKPPGEWVQYGDAQLYTRNSAFAVNMAGGRWTQYGAAHIETSYGSNGMSMGSASGTAGVWDQHGNVDMVLAGAYGVLTQLDAPIVWNQWGSVTMQLNASAGVLLRRGGSWNQYNSTSMDMSQSTGVDLAGNWTLGASSSLKMTVGDSSDGVRFASGSAANWTQGGQTTLEVVGSFATGVRLSGGAGLWSQTQPLTLSVGPGASSNGVLFSSSAQKWVQYSTVQITVQGEHNCGVNFSTAGSSLWQQIGPTPNVSTSGLDSSGLCPAPLPSPTVQAITVTINSTTPSVVISPQNASTDGGYGQKAQIDFLTLREVTPEGAVVWQAQLQDGWLQSGSASGNSSSTSIFTSKLANNATLTYKFSTYQSSSDLTLANNYTFTVTPAFLKFSLLLDRWNWSTSDNKLQFQMVISPSFAATTIRPNTPQAEMTSMLLESAVTTDASTLVRLLNFALTNGTQPVNCASSADIATSSIFLTFDYFEADLDYDPDISLLLGGTKDDGGNGGGGGTEWVIAVAVAVPVAVAVVVLIIAAALLATYVRSRRRNSAKAINFDGAEGDGVDAL